MKQKHHESDSMFVSQIRIDLLFAMGHFSGRNVKARAGLDRRR